MRLNDHYFDFNAEVFAGSLSSCLNVWLCENVSTNLFHFVIILREALVMFKNCRDVAVFKDCRNNFLCETFVMF